MEVQGYISSNTLPYKIQEILRDKGFYIEPLHEVHEYTNRLHGACSFRITKGADTLRVLGIAEEKDEFHFHMVEDPSEDGFTSSASNEFYNEVEEIMLDNGVRLADSEEL